MSRIEPVTLSGRVVRLEPMAKEHLNRLCDVALDPELWRWTPIILTNPDDVRCYVEQALKAQAAGLEVPFVTVEVATGNVIGSTKYLNIDLANRRLEIGSTFITRLWQRSVVNTEAKYLMLRHAFEVVGCMRVELKTDALNQQSRNAILRIGAKEEGTLRQHVVTYTGRKRDTVYFSILDNEWPGVKADLERKLAAN